MFISGALKQISCAIFVIWILTAKFALNTKSSINNKNCISPSADLVYRGFQNKPRLKVNF